MVYDVCVIQKRKKWRPLIRAYKNEHTKEKNEENEQTKEKNEEKDDCKKWVWVRFNSKESLEEFLK